MSVVYHPKLKDDSKKYKGQAIAKQLYNEALHLRNVFIECDIIRADPKKWKILSDYLSFEEAGCPTHGQIREVRTYIARFGRGSSFYAVWFGTRLERGKYTQRLFYTCRRIDELFKTGDFTRKEQQQYSHFKNVAINLVSILRMRPLTIKQKKYLWDIEHRLGIWWDDLSDEENGMQPTRRKE